MFWRWSVFESDFTKQTKNSEKDGLKGNFKGKYYLHWFIKTGLLILPKTSKCSMLLQISTNTAVVMGGRLTTKTIMLNRSDKIKWSSYELRNGSNNIQKWPFLKLIK